MKRNDMRRRKFHFEIFDSNILKCFLLIMKSSYFSFIIFFYSKCFSDTHEKYKNTFNNYNKNNHTQISFIQQCNNLYQIYTQMRKKNDKKKIRNNQL